MDAKTALKQNNFMHTVKERKFALKLFQNAEQKKMYGYDQLLVHVQSSKRRWVNMT
jgi:hypothetical protein